MAQFKTFNDQQVRALLKKPGKHRIDRNLYLRVTPSGAGFWTFIYRAPDGRDREAGLGRYPDTSLLEAKTKAGTMRLLLKRDRIDPLEHMRLERARANGADAFRRVAGELIASKRAGWKSVKHAGQWEATLSTYANPLIGNMSVAAITTDHVLAVLRPIWESKHETAGRLRQRIEAVLDAAIARGLRDGMNPARWKGHLDKLLPAISKRARVKHHAALPWKDAPSFMAELRARGSISARALEFCILTACRTGEVIGARWEEVDFEQAIWTIPAARMKSKREHRVPLPDAAMKLLQALPRVDGCPYVFPGARGNRPLSNMAMLELLRDMRQGLTVHGFRSTFRDWVSDATIFNPEIAEMALAHTIGNQVEAAYRRGDLLERRRELMQAWSDFLKGEMK